MDPDTSSICNIGVDGVIAYPLARPLSGPAPSDWPHPSCRLSATAVSLAHGQANHELFSAIRNQIPLGQVMRVPYLALRTDLFLLIIQQC